MTISFISNISSLSVQRQLNNASKEVSTAFERLSSGLRVNRASDDPAGFQLSSNLNLDSRVYSRGVRNVNDGISLLQIADSALSELTSIVTRIQELAGQAANGVATPAQRKALDREAQGLAKEFARMARTTEFGGRVLFDGNFGQAHVQPDYSAFTFGLSGAIGDGTIRARTAYATGNDPEFVATADFNGDGKLDLVTADEFANTLSVHLGNGDGTFQPRTSYATRINPEAVVAADFNGDAKVDLASADAVDNTVEAVS